MKNTAIASSVIAVTLTLLLVFSAPAAFAQAGGRGGGSAAVGGRGGGIAGGGARGGAITGRHQGRFVGPHHQFRQGRFFPRHQFRRNFFFSGFGGNVFVPAWWWYDPSYYYWSSPAYYSGYYNYPYYDYYGYPDWSDPCLSSDPAYAQYCPQSGYPPEGDYYGAPPVGYYTVPEAPMYPESGSVSPSPAPLEQQGSSGNQQ